MSAHQDESQGPDTGAVAMDAPPRVKPPGRWRVILHNDDYSTFDFVVEVLKKFFKHTDESAAQITLEVHHKGRGIAGVYSRDIAETKVVQVGEYAKASKFPLKCTAEPEDL